MAPPAGTLRVGRYFLALADLVRRALRDRVLARDRSRPKLGLDLRGGAQVIYKAQTTNGKAPSRDSMNQAKSIIDQRVNGLGVEQSQVVIQGSDEIVVTVPGKRADQLAERRRDRAAELPAADRRRVRRHLGRAPPRRRPRPASGSATGSADDLASTASSVATPSGGVSPAPSSGASGQNAGDRPIAADSSTPAASSTHRRRRRRPHRIGSASPRRRRRARVARRPARLGVARRSTPPRSGTPR